MPRSWRKRATNMAWTPGLVLDYTRALHAVVHPTDVSLIHLLKKRWFTAADTGRQLTFSSHATGLPSTASEMAMWVIAVCAQAPCQCLTPGGIHAISP
ncbi:Uncharacterised protein [Leclercia adecarboxylata]|uniref:Uncharacterized protein n=1 Tax=Leclercia adecarboxylata TaxID=83655 RepID=A0A4U9HV44_9ENTR|nr:Uncharacterised protein [Leclercia adecarboxylata]